MFMFQTLNFECLGAYLFDTFNNQMLSDDSQSLNNVE
jgi:hypothetical protein